MGSASGNSIYGGNSTVTRSSWSGDGTTEDLGEIVSDPPVVGGIVGQVALSAAEDEKDGTVDGIIIDTDGYDMSLDWKQAGSCVGVNPNLFFPERGQSTLEAKEVCRTCVIREACLEYALSAVEKHGIWGGMSERERRRIRRQRRLNEGAPKE